MITIGKGILATTICCWAVFKELINNNLLLRRQWIYGLGIYANHSKQCFYLFIMNYVVAFIIIGISVIRLTNYLNRK